MQPNLELPRELIEHVLNYWFADLSDESAISMEHPHCKIWYVKDKEVDIEIRSLFYGSYHKYEGMTHFAPPDVSVIHRLDRGMRQCLVYKCPCQGKQ